MSLPLSTPPILLPPLPSNDVDALLASETRRARRMARGRYRLSAEDAEDVAQELAVKLWQALPGFRDVEALPRWTAVVVRNTCLKLHTARIAVELEDDDGVDVADRDDEALVSERDVQDLDAYLAATSDRLATRLARAHYLQGVSVKALADANDLPLNTVLSHLHRFRKAAREALARQ